MSRIIALAIVRSFRATAVNATLAFFPDSRSLRYIALRVMLDRDADSAAMYSEVRTCLRPPKIDRSPFFVPLSRARDARPARAAICLPVSRPSSGRRPRSANDV